MPGFRIDLDMISWGKLAEIAVEQRRPIAWQAQRMLMQLLGTAVPEHVPCLPHGSATERGETQP